MDINKHTPGPDSAADINLMIREHHAAENLELRERVADLELERDTLLVYFKASLHELHKAIVREQRRHEDRQRLETEVRDLRAMIVSESYGDGVGVMGTTPYGLPDLSAIEARP